MNVNMSDVGNLVIGIGGAISSYLAWRGFIGEAALVIGISLAVKAFFSAVNNYGVKKDKEVTDKKEAAEEAVAESDAKKEDEEAKPCDGISVTIEPTS